MIKQPQKFVDTDADDSDAKEEEPRSQKTSPGPVDKELTQPVKAPSAASCSPMTSYTYILISGVRKGKQCKLKTSDKTDKFCHLHKMQA